MARPQPNLITFEIDGREVQAPEGMMLVDAAKHGDVEIPFFCYEPKLGQPVGACRMCLVEIEGIPKLQTSCSTPIRDGMVVNTTSDRVKHAQSAVVEFLLVNHPLDCPVCDKGGECPLQDISFGWGGGRSRFIEPKRHFKKPLNLSPLVAIDRERCILCYRCVRFSQEVAEDYQLVFLERGDHTFVGTHDGRPYVAPFSGNIIELCPVGALTSQAYRFRARPWDIEDSGTVCTMCPSQCNVTLTIRDDAKVVRVLARDNVEVDDGWLCDKGRFGYQSFSSAERFTRPMVRDGGYLREVSWERALTDAANLLSRSGAGTVAHVGGTVTNEEGFLVQRLLREALGSPHVTSGPALAGVQARALAAPALAARVSDIDHAGAILVLDTELVDEAPILDLRVRKAVRRHGTRLIVASSRPSTLDANATAALRFPPGGAAAALGALTARLRGADAGDGGVTPGFIPGLRHDVSDPGVTLLAAADTLRDAGDVVVIWGERLIGAGAVDALLELAGAAGAAGEESGLIGIPSGSNGRGLREVGCSPLTGPGLADAADGGDPDEARGALLLVETERPERELARATSVIAFARYPTEELAEHANVVFPAEIYAEKEGTLTHPDGRLQRVRQALGRAGEVRPGWQVLAELCERTGAGAGVLAATQVTALIAGAVPFYAGLTLDAVPGTGARWQESDGASALAAEGLPGAAEQPGAAAGRDGELTLAGATTLWTGPEVEHSPSLAFLLTGPTVELSVADARRLGVENGEEVELSVAGERAWATARVRTGVVAGSAFVSPPVLPDGPVEVTRARAGAAAS